MIARSSGLVTVRKQCSRPAAADDNSGVRAALDAIAMLAIDTLDSADHAGVTLVEGRGIKCLAATDVHPLMVNNLQRRSREGPCFDLATGSEAILVDDLAAEARWPDFSAAAASTTPVRALLAQTVFHDSDACAVFTLYADRPGAFDTRTATASSTFVSQMARILAAGRRGEQASRSASTHGGAAVLMQRFGIDAQQALGMLEKMATERGETIEAVAEQVVAETARGLTPRAEGVRGETGSQSGESDPGGSPAGR
jgi:hypothetical protein